MYGRKLQVLLVLLLLGSALARAQSIATDGNIETDAQLVSNVATGTAPLAVSSTTLVPSLNADQVDGVEGTDLALDADLQTAETMLMALQAQVDALGLALVGCVPIAVEIRFRRRPPSDRWIDPTCYAAS